MNEQDTKAIRWAIEDCLAGMEVRPGLEGRIRARMEGQRPAPRRLTAAVALALVITLLAAAALAAGFLLLRWGQEDMGPMRDCAAVGDTLYVMTGSGLYTYQAEQEPALLLSMADMNRQGLTQEALLFECEGGIGLLDRQSGKLWQLEEGRLAPMEGWDGSALPLQELKLTRAVAQEDSLFVLAAPEESEEGGRVYRLTAGSEAAAMEPLPIRDVAEICGYGPGRLLVLTQSVRERQCRLVVVDTATGQETETLYTGGVQEVEGLAYDAKAQRLYATVQGQVAAWQGGEWSKLQGAAHGHLSHAWAVVGDGYVSLSYDQLQYLPFAKAGTLPTLRICGYGAMYDEDSGFQQAMPGVAVVRDRQPTLTAAQVAQAIQSGDTTDLFYLRLDGDLAALFRDGMVLPLNESPALTEDSRAMLPVVQQGLWQKGQLCAVPMIATVQVWDAETPATWPELLRQVAAGQVKLVRPWASEGWTKSDYADFWLTTTIAEQAQAGRELDFSSEAFTSGLQALRALRLPEGEAASMVTTNGTLSLAGQASVGAVDHWAAPCAVGQSAQPNVPMSLIVYVVNPNGENRELALAYLEYVAAHRSPENEALLKPEVAQPRLHPGVEAQMAWMEEEQRAYDAELGQKTDEAALQARLDALMADPSSWAVEAGRLAAYRETIAPYVDLRLSPWLASSARARDGGYLQLLARINAYAEGEGTLEECMEALWQIRGKYTGNTRPALDRPRIDLLK